MMPGIPAEHPLDACRPRRRRRSYRRHGFYALRTTLRALGPRVLGRRTTLGKALAAWKADLVRDLGGDVSTQQAAIVDLSLRTRLLLEPRVGHADVLRAYDLAITLAAAEASA